MTKKVAKKKVAKKAAKPKLRSFVFTGNGLDDPGNIEMFVGGVLYTFELDGKAVKVNDEAAAKLADNGHFTEK